MFEATACFYCAEQFVYESAHAKEPTLDHLIPLSRGGLNTVGNVVACCRECNNRKYTKTATEFLAKLGNTRRNAIAMQKGQFSHVR